MDPSVREMVALKVKTHTPTDQVTIELARGGTVSLDPYGDGLYCTVLSPTDVLFGYQTDDVNHNFVGYIDLYKSGTRSLRFNGFIDVRDERIPNVTVTSLSSDAQASPRIFNYLNADVPPETYDFGTALENSTLPFYQYFTDIYDDLCIASVPKHSQNRYYIWVRNDVQGIGAPIYNYTRRFGSDGRLLGAIRYPISAYYDLGELGSMHEFGHQYGVRLRLPALPATGSHWPISSLAIGVLQVQDSSGQGVNFPFRLTPLGNGDYRLDAAEVSGKYNDMELYLMGLVPASEVGAHFVFVDQKQQLCSGCLLKGPTVSLTVADVVAAYGPRIPSATESQRSFRIGTIVVSMDRLLTAREMAFFDYFAARGEATEPLPYTLGFSRGTSQPFYLATGKRATFTTSLGPRR